MSITELCLESLNLAAALSIFYFVVRLTPTLNLNLQKQAVRLLLVATAAFSLNEALAFVSLFWGGAFWEVIREILEGVFIFSMAIALFLLFRSDRREVTQLSKSATTDKLTSLHNVGYFKQVAHQRFDLARVGNLPLSLIILDADNFKSYNDTFGHEAGNVVLCSIAQHLRASVREGQDDIVARYGGEEFVVLLSSSLAVAEAMAERIRAAIDQHCRPSETPALKRAVTVSVGVAALAPNLNTFEDLIVAADQAMYNAKQTGKNQVKIAPPASPTHNA
jgi:diguanylate cyclase (GGDEF)-like protein